MKPRRNFPTAPMRFCETLFHLCLFAIIVLDATALAQTAKLADILVADFEGDTYGEWTAEGEAFGSSPAKGTLKGQMRVSGFQGKQLANSFLGGDRTTGTLTSPEFEIERPWLNFLIGGGGHEAETCMNLLVNGKVVRTATGANNRPGGSEELLAASWDVTQFIGKPAVIQIVDRHKGGWGHINVDRIVLSDTKTAATRVTLEKTLTVDGSHLIVPVANGQKTMHLGIHHGDQLIQSFNVALPRDDDAYWLAAYPLEYFDLKGQAIRLAPVDGKRQPESCNAAFDRIKVGSASDALEGNDYDHPYRDQFHVTTRRGWNNDPNGMVFHGGKYHLYYQHNPFGISWGNMHWGHFESTDLIHWDEKPIALFQKTPRDAMFSGGGFVDVQNTAGLGIGTLFVAFTSTGRGECLAYSKDGGATFTELEENPVVKHRGRDPKILWYASEQKWVMVIFDDSECAETRATPPAEGSPQNRAQSNIVFYESKDLRRWTRTGAFTDPDRLAVFECPEMFELSIETRPDQSRWILYGAQNRYFIGRFDGKTFHKDSGPHGAPRGQLYAAQTFSDVPDGRRIQIGWIRTQPLVQKFPDQIVSQGFSLPQELTLRETDDGLRVFMNPVREVKGLRGELLTESTDGLGVCEGRLCEVLIEFEKTGNHELMLNGFNANFTGKSARIFVDRTICELYINDGAEYHATARVPAKVDSTESVVIGDSKIKSASSLPIEFHLELNRESGGAGSKHIAQDEQGLAGKVNQMKRGVGCPVASRERSRTGR